MTATPGDAAHPDPTLDTDVIVVGAGPVGLLLARDLCAGGARVTVLEQRTEPMTESRASTLHTRTMGILAERGLLGRLGELPSGGVGHFGGIPLDLAIAAPTDPYAGQWKCPQTRIEAVLAEVATELGARIQRGQRVTELTGLEDHVRVGTVTAEGDEHWMTSAYVVGCDGEQSTVRRVAGFELSGDAATRKMLRADVAGIEIPNRRFERHAHGLATAFRWPDGSTRVMVHVYGTSPEEYSNEPEYAEVAAAWAKVTGEDIRDGTPSWLNAFDDARWQVTEYRRGRVLLAGDAAHVQMPVGGQALNLGLQDAAELGGRLLERLTTRAGDEALDEYHRERAAVGSRTLTNIRAQALLLLGGPEVNPLRNLFTELMGFDSVQGHFARMISGKRVPEVPTRKVQKTISSVDRSFEMGRLNNKTALVTGASRGIGRATAMRLSEEGALVAVHYATNEAAARETVSSIEKNGGRAFPVRAELGASGDVHELFLGLEQGLKERTGDTTIDVVVNNAGETTPAGLAPEDVTPEQFDRLFAVNAKAPYFIVQRALNNLSDGGRVINISSGLTRFANPEQVAYSMSKGAIEQISLHFARHLASRRITVNTVAPGITNNGSEIFETPEIVEQMAQLSAFKRVGEAVDVADVVTFLASDEARWITGAFIDASGGTLLG